MFVITDERGKGSPAAIWLPIEAHQPMRRLAVFCEEEEVSCVSTSMGRRTNPLSLNHSPMEL
jgi:hypothetical protein